jgi:hypothetical protein
MHDEEFKGTGSGVSGEQFCKFGDVSEDLFLAGAVDAIV